eukprot:Tamp_14827.p1 GENE.Tamp_14827~~Tamp_14827.p1  ORF type:complete len:320 (+),score=28.24 Tamp_14827:80-1039(+)
MEANACRCEHPRGGNCTHKRQRTDEERARHRDVSNRSYANRMSGSGGGQRPAERVHQLQQELEAARLQQRETARELAALRQEMAQGSHVHTELERLSRLRAGIIAEEYSQYSREALEKEVHQLRARLLETQNEVPVDGSGAACEPPSTSVTPPIQDAIDFMNIAAGGQKITEIFLSTVKRTDTNREINLFELASNGRKSGTVRLGGLAGVRPGDFCYLVASADKKKRRLVRITEVSAAHNWGELMSVHKNSVVEMEGLHQEGGAWDSTVEQYDFWIVELSQWLANFWGSRGMATKHPTTGQNILKNSTSVRMVRWRVVQ